MAKTKLQRQNKYNAVRSEGFDSMAEREYCGLLELMKQAGEIQDYIHHPPAVKFECGRGWRIDFLVYDKDGNEYYVEVKGMELPVYKFQLALYKHEIKTPLIVVKKSGKYKFKTIEWVNWSSLGDKTK